MFWINAGHFINEIQMKDLRMADALILKFLSK